MIGKKEIIIIAPHCDDEIIGCFEIMRRYPTTIYFMEEMEEQRVSEANNLRSLFPIQSVNFSSKIPKKYTSFTERDRIQLFFPDPIYETHPMHRKWGHVGETYLRNGFDVIFYNTNMKAPYIREIRDWKRKRDSLNTIYPSQSDLWSGGNGQYYLFEGYNKWILQP